MEQPALGFILFVPLAAACLIFLAALAVLLIRLTLSVERAYSKLTKTKVEESYGGTSYHDL